MAEEYVQRELSKFGFGGPEPSPVTPVVSDLAIKRAQRKLEEESTEKDSFWSLFRARQQDAGTIPSAFALLDRPTPVKDEPISAEIINELTLDITDEKAVKRILDALESKGVTYARAIASEVRNTIETNKRLDKAGLRGAGAKLLSDSTDLAEVAIMTASAATLSAIAPAAAPATVPAAAVGALKLGKLFGRFKDNKKYLAAVMGVGAAELGGLEYLRAQHKYDITGGDIILAASIGAGANLGFTRLGQVYAKRAMIKRAELKEASGETLTEFETNLLRQNNEETLAEKYIQEAYDNDDFDVDGAVEAIEGSGLTRKDFTDMTKEELAAVPRQRGIFPKQRGFISSFVRAKNSEDGVARWLADRTGLNSTGNIPGPNGERIPVGYGALEQRDVLQMVYRVAIANPIKNIIEKSGFSQKEELYELTSRFMRGSREQMPPSVLEAAEIYRKNMDKLYRLAIKYNVAGFTKDMIGSIENYLPRMTNQDKILKYRQTTLKDNADGTLNEGWFTLGEEAIRRGQPDIETMVAASLKKKGKTSDNKAVQSFIKRMSRGYMQALINPRLSNNTRFKFSDGNFDVEDFMSIMRAEGIFDDDQLEVMLDVLTRNAKVKGHPRSRPRMILDEMAEVTLTDPDGNLFNISFNNILEENIDTLYNNYVFQLAGAIGLARNGINTNKPGSNFYEILKQAVGATESERKALEFMYQSITGEWAYTGAMIAGQPMSRRTKRWMARGRELSFAANMGMSGMAAIMETSNSLFEFSLPTLMKTVPMYSSIIRRAKNGEFESKVMREMAAGTGVGSDGLTSKVTSLKTREDGDVTESVAIAGEYTWMDQALGNAREFVAKWSGLRGVTDVLRRVSLYNYASEWAYKHKAGEIAFSPIRREQLGISDDMARRIRNQIDEHAEYLPDGTLEALHVDRWSTGKNADPEAAELFFYSARRAATQAVQEMNVGSVNPLLRSEVGKSFFQFLSFPMSSLEQQAMRQGVRFMNGDSMEVSRIMLSSLFLGSMMYMSRSYLNSMGRSDQKDYMKKRMATEELLQGSLSQIGAASLFGYIYQITTGTMDGNTNVMTPPAVSMIGAGLKGGSDILGAYLSGEEDLTEAELRSFLRIFPFTSIYGAKQILNSFADIATVDK